TRTASIEPIRAGSCTSSSDQDSNLRQRVAADAQSTIVPGCGCRPDRADRPRPCPGCNENRVCGHPAAHYGGAGRAGSATGDGADMVKFQSELQQLEDSLKAMTTNYEQRAVVLSPEARQHQDEAIRQKQRAYQQRAGELEDQAGRRQAELFEPIMARISQAINEVRAEGGYAVILDAAAGGIVAADPSLDLTEQVLTRLKAMATAGNRQQR